jgi:hypothetical protein
VKASDILSELSINPDFNLLTQPEQLEIINFAQQEVCNYYNSNIRSNYTSSPFPDSVSQYFGSLALAIKKQVFSFSGTQIYSVSGGIDMTIPKQTISFFGANGYYSGSSDLTIVKQVFAISGTFTSP